MIDTLFIFAAGKGTRMEHLTQSLPKPLIPILAKPILYYALEFALTYPFKKIVINSHYLPNQIHDSVKEFKKIHKLRKLPEIVEIFEPEILETGGAVKNAIAILGDKPIFTLNSDVIIKAANINIFEQLEQTWNVEIMDFLLLMQPFNEATGYKGKGDFEIQSDGQLSRPHNLAYYKYMYAGLSIINLKLVSSNVQNIFSLKDYYLTCKRVYGSIITGFKWYHATTPSDVEAIEQELSKGLSL